MILSKNAASRMHQKVQAELILFLHVLVMQKHVCTWGWRTPPQSCSSYCTSWYETDVFEKQYVFCLSVPWKYLRLFCWSITFKCDPGFAHPLKWNWRILLTNCLCRAEKEVQYFVNVSSQVEVLLIACWRVEMEKAIPLISWVWRS